ncbi:unnamed protein product [Soboliphyme baturini]|uniref:HCNGP-like protein n=1 Tax=Soboliphyme baturini TaxID=241478 RepID=A0A183IVV1_9BILA|nr:unnamed protein product [Soboliphyme baturini]
MDRVNSSAIRSLAAYNDDSDDDSESGSASPAATASSPKDKILPGKQSPRQNASAAVSSAEEMGSGTGTGTDAHSSATNSPWISDYEGNSPTGGDPEAPRRPQFYHSPSSAASYPSETPSSFTLSRMSSGIALVSYGAEDDEQGDDRRNSISANDDAVIEMLDEHVEQVLSVTAISTANDDSQPPLKFEVGDMPKRVMKSEDEEEIDVDVLLEKPLANAVFAETNFRPASEGHENFRRSEILYVSDLIPSKACDAQAKFKEFFRRKAAGYDFNKAIQNRTDFRNPSIYEKLIEHFGIDEIGTNFPKEVFDPHGFKPCDFYDEIAKIQRSLMEKLEKEKHAVKESNILSIGEDRKRKSKWDNPPSVIQSLPPVGKTAISFTQYNITVLKRIA